MPEQTLLAFADHGRIGGLLSADGVDAEAVLAGLAHERVDARSLATRLQLEGTASFVGSWKALLDRIAAKRALLTAVSAS
jgi:transaldolase